MDIRVARDEANDTTILSLQGQLDIDTAASFSTALDDLHRPSASRIVIDLDDLEFCDSIGLSALVVAYHRATAAGGYLRLAAPNPFLLRLLTVVGIRDTIPVYRSAAAACRGDPTEIISEAPASDPPRRTVQTDR